MSSSLPQPAQPRLTRDCLDPWRYLEISAAGNIRPCCNFSSLAELGDGDNVADARNNDGFRTLRESLLSGDLQPPCAQCHIRKMVPATALKQRLDRSRRLNAGRGPINPLDPLPIAELRIDINEKCNLRCDYCAVSSPDYRGVEMDGALFATVAEIVRDASPGAVVNVNGHGETTYHPNWMAMCRTIVEAGYRPQIISNLAKNYSSEEIALLARFSSIQVSLDSDDDKLMKTIRKSVRTAHVFETIQRIRDAATLAKMRPAPRISFSIGLYDPSIWTIESFLDRIIAAGVRDVTFWNLVEMPHQTLVKPLRALAPEDQKRARDILGRVQRKLETANIGYVFAGDFDAMVGKLPATLRLRSTLRRAYRAFGRWTLAWR